jgi:hypothetical protein
MRCGTAERLLHLHREGELRPRQRERLERHLVRCPVCRQRARSIQADLARLEAARREISPPPIPGGLTETILRRILPTGASGRARPVRRTGGGFAPLLRPLPALLGLLLLGALALQEYLILNRLAALEGRLEATALHTLTPGGTPVLGSELERGIGRLDAAARLLERTESLGHAGDWVVVRRTDLVALRETLRRVPGSEGGLPQVVVDRYPELGAVRLEDGLDRTELDLLLAHRAELLRLLRSL